MKEWSLYDLLAVIAPGMLVLVAVAIHQPTVIDAVLSKDLSAGAFGLITILAYIAGSLLQTLGNLLEKLYWKVRGGSPTSLAGLKNRNILTESDVSALMGKAVSDKLMPANESGTAPEAGRWKELCDRIVMLLMIRGHADRYTLFRTHYGFNRGLGIGFLVVAISVSIRGGQDAWALGACFLGVSIATFFRMDHFGRSYGKSVFHAYLSSFEPPVDGKSPVDKTSGGKPNPLVGMMGD